MIERAEIKTAWAKLLMRSASMNLVSKVAGTALVFITHVLLARLLSKQAYGDYTYVLSLLTILILVGKLGLDTAAIRFVSKYDALKKYDFLNGFIRQSFRTTVVVSIVVSVLYALIVATVGGEIRDELRVLLLVAAILIPLNVLARMLSASIQGLRWVVIAQALENVVRPGLLLLIILGLIYFLGNISALLVVESTIVSVFLLILLSVFVLEVKRPGKGQGYQYEKSTGAWLATSMPFLLISSSNVVFSSADIIIVGSILGTSESGAYAVASRIAGLTGFALVAVNAYVAPQISRLYEKGDMQSLKNILCVSIIGSSIVTLGIAAGIILFSESLLGIFGEQYVYTNNVMIIILFGHLVNALVGSVGVVLNMTGHQVENMKILLMLTIINILFSIPMVIYFGIIGAAIVTTLSIVIKNILLWWKVRQLLGINPSIVGCLFSR